jgi:glycosyltransferase involved in cell wall biosynthesis
MKVLHVIARMNVGGTARYVDELVRSAPAHGYQAELATGHVQGDEVEDACMLSLPAHRISYLGRAISPAKDFRAYLELKKLIQELKPDVVHSHTYKAGLIARLIRGNFKRVHTFHGHLFEDQSFTSLEKFVILLSEKFLSKRTDQFISVGARVGVELRSLGIGSAKKWISIPPGVRKLKSISKSEARTKLNLPPTGLIVGWMARVTSVKNPKMAVEIAKYFPETEFVIAGGGDLLPEIKRSAGSNVNVIGWVDAALMWSAVDIVLSTSDNEGMPIALIEAQLAGLPVVATDVGSTSEVILNGETGFVVSKDIGEVTNSLSRLMKEEELRKRLSEAAIAHAEKSFTLEKMVSEHAHIYLNM